MMFGPPFPTKLSGVSFSMSFAAVQLVLAAGGCACPVDDVSEPRLQKGSSQDMTVIMCWFEAHGA